MSEPHPGDVEAIAVCMHEVVMRLEGIPQGGLREGLTDTPRRVARALLEMTSGRHQDPKDILSKTFDVACDEMVLVRDISFQSLCEHHMLPFVSVAHVAYIPNGRVVGLSKIARLVQCFARRLQVQERLTNQIADAMETHLQTKGVGVLLESTHACMTNRGIRQHNAKMLTSALRGALKEDPKARAEFLGLARQG